MSPQNIYLSPSIRDWVVLPLLLIMILTGLLRTLTSQLLRSSKPLKDVKLKSVLQRGSRLRSAGGFISRDRWLRKKDYYTSKPNGALRPEGPILSGSEEEPAAPAMPNPATAMEGMMGNASFMIQNMIMMQAIQHFFSGYILVQIPFGLTKGFKLMTQKGIDLPTLSTSYVSSLSWYFLVMFGLRGVFRLLVGDPAPSTKQGFEIQQSLGNGFQNPQPFKSGVAFKGECEMLEICKYRSVIENSERELLGNEYPKFKRRVVKGKRKDDIFGE